jgi:uncharacterized protein YciI
MRATTNRHHSTFFRCLRAETDTRFTRYPPLPVRACPGYEVAMLFVILMHYTKPVAAVDAVRADHLKHLQGLADQGVMRAWARRDPPVGNVLIAAAADRATIEAAIARDPYITAGLARAEIVTFDPQNVRFFEQRS